MTANQTSAWPEGVIARYLTVGGAIVDITTQPGEDAATATAGTCSGCGAVEIIDWIRPAWSSYANQYVEELDEGGEHATPKVRGWAQAHAEKCRAMPRPGGDTR
jgi:hypothetical protein